MRVRPVGGRNVGDHAGVDVTLAGSSIRDADLSGVQIDDCNLVGMRIDGIEVAALMAAYQKVQNG